MKHAEHFEQQVSSSIEASIAVKARLLSSTESISTVAKVTAVIVDCIEQGNKILLFGNGGSAADAQHIAAEFVGRFAFNRRALAALALSVNTSCVTAIGNDYGFDLIFSRQVEALGRAGDVAIGISTSGNSQNVLNAVSIAKELGLQTVGLTGNDGGKLKHLVDYWLSVPSSDTPRIQECHILIGHILSELVEHTIFHEQTKSHEQKSCVSGS